MSTVKNAHGTRDFDDKQSGKCLDNKEMDACRISRGSVANLDRGAENKTSLVPSNAFDEAFFVGSW